ncbi:MAG: DUF3131 domain-containing protein [Gammaproteobacteria bacterium]|nr:DUF3131 domain-containing protein [Gammaproteobacteria bacterium]
MMYEGSAGKRLCVAVVMAGSTLFTSWSYAFESALLGPGLKLFEAGEAEAATRAWVDASSGLLRRSKRPESLRQAAIAEVATSAALSMVKDARAYEHWGNAMQYFLRSGTTWEQERNRIQARLTNLGRRLASVSATSGPPRVGPDDLTLMALEDNLNVTLFVGPAPGLQDRPEQAQLNVSRDYFARPANELDKAGAGQESRSRQGRPGAAASRPAEDRVLDRRIVPRVTTTNGPAKIKVVARVTDARVALSRGIANENQGEESQTNSPRRGTRAETRPKQQDANADKSVSRVPAKTGVEPKSDVTVRAMGQRDVRVGASQPPATSPGATQGKEAVAGEVKAPPAATQLASVSRSRQAVIPLTPAKTKSSQVAGLAFRSPLGGSGGLSEAELAMAQTAWRYFGANRQSNTGLYSSVSGYPYSSTWGIASSLAALVAAEQLQLIDTAKFKGLIKHFLTTLGQLPLYNGELPNREYDARNGKMVDSRNRASNSGSGWSAVDIGRLLIWLKILMQWYPEYEETVRALVGQWSFDRLTENQQLNGAFYDGKSEHVFQEGRLGYEQYAAYGYALWDLVLPNALDYEDVQVLSVDGMEVPADSRPYSFLTLEGFMLGKLELGGLDPDFVRFFLELYDAHRTRYKRTAILTAATEDAVDKEPWFVYNTIADGEHAWRCRNHSGDVVATCQWLSTKAAVALSALFNDEYSRELRAGVGELIDPRQGFFAGRYESGEPNRALSVNTNAVVLEAMLYLHRSGRPFIESSK